MDELHQSISRWLEKNAPFLEYRIPLEDCLTTDPVQAMYCGTIPRMREAENHLKSAGLDGKITVLKTEYPHRDLCMFDVLNYACSKGHAVERWAAHRQIPRDQIMAIGDNYNDREMLQYAGIPVVMGNASDELKQLGWTVTLSNDEGGVAAAIEQALGLQIGEYLKHLRSPRQLGLLLSIALCSLCISAADAPQLPALRSISHTEYDAVLQNGFSIHHLRRETLGETTRLFVSNEATSYIDIPTAQIQSIQEVQVADKVTPAAADYLSLTL